MESMEFRHGQTNTTIAFNTNGIVLKIVAFVYKSLSLMAILLNCDVSLKITIIKANTRGKMC